MKLYNPFHKHRPTIIEASKTDSRFHYSTCGVCGKDMIHIEGWTQWELQSDPMDGMDDSFDLLFFGILIIIFAILIGLGSVLK